VHRRILLFLTDLEIGGTPTVVRDLARHLRDPGKVHIEVACLGRFGPIAHQLKDEAFHVTAFNARGIFDLRVVHSLNHLLRSRSCDTCLSFLVHANTVAAISSLFLRDIRYIQCIQTTQPNPRWHWKVQQLAAGAAKKILVPSPSVAQAAQSRSHIPAGKITVIPNAIDPACFENLQTDYSQARPFPIAFIGRLDPIKRLDDLLIATQRLSGKAHLHIYGDGTERHHIEYQINSLGIQPCVTLHGTIPNPQSALRQIGLLVLPSAAEGFPMVLIEAMAAGIPIVATKAPGISDVLQNEKTALLVPIADPIELAAAIARLIDDATLRSALSANAFNQVRQHFTWPSVLPQYHRLLDLENQ